MVKKFKFLLPLILKNLYQESIRVNLSICVSHSQLNLKKKIQNNFTKNQSTKLKIDFINGLREYCIKTMFEFYYIAETEEDKM
ncbi:hypothetical protein BpHYR1_024064 [Brachionus plicatilis]|uniref:Uncharacterized protein n=1 Tax=Brachionus plicatilis TaxID=10195 RepID=A0A3M7R9E0_BRAPC|nr:hypothetical protein BpHYR1_024064 [Brachionus plicatilis]